jgi:molybdate transport system substrate-binding protein
MRLTRRILVALTLGALVLGPSSHSAQADDPVVVFAAASLKNALDDAAVAWAKENGKTARISYAGSNTLAKQIEAGAPADLFISADQAWMDDVGRAGLLKPGSRIDLLRNALVLIGPGPKNAGSDPRVALAPDLGTTLTKLLGGGKLAMATIDAVPAGRYGKAALEKLGAWEVVKGQVAQADNVRAALLLVARGEAPLGIVYATDAVADPSVQVLATFPPDSHPPIVYPAAVIQGSRNPEAAVLLRYLRGPAARSAFEHQGFSVVEAPAAGR